MARLRPTALVIVRFSEKTEARVTRPKLPFVGSADLVIQGQIRLAIAELTDMDEVQQVPHAGLVPCLSG